MVKRLPTCRYLAVLLVTSVGCASAERCGPVIRTIEARPTAPSDLSIDKTSWLNLLWNRHSNVALSFASNYGDVARRDSEPLFFGFDEYRFGIDGFVAEVPMHWSNPQERHPPQGWMSTVFGPEVGAFYVEAHAGQPMCYLRLARSAYRLVRLGGGELILSSISGHTAVVELPARGYDVSAACSREVPVLQSRILASSSDEASLQESETKLAIVESRQSRRAP